MARTLEYNGHAFNYIFKAHPLTMGLPTAVLAVGVLVAIYTSIVWFFTARRDKRSLEDGRLKLNDVTYSSLLNDSARRKHRFQNTLAYSVTGAVASGGYLLVFPADNYPFNALDFAPLGVYLVVLSVYLALCYYAFKRAMLALNSWVSKTLVGGLYVFLFAVMFASYGAVNLTLTDIKVFIQITLFATLVGSLMYADHRERKARWQAAMSQLG